MNEHTVHVHRCACGTAWICGRVDCQDDTCIKCEHENYERYAEKRGWMTTQPDLPELAAAGFKEEF